MASILVYGFLTGAFLSVGFGTIFFMLIQTSAEHGYKAGVKIALGVVLSDIIMITVAVLGASFIPFSNELAVYGRLIGAIFLISLALFQLKKTSLLRSAGHTRAASFFYFMSKGFLLNILNPTNFISWLVVSTSLQTYQYDGIETFVFFTSSMVALFLSESLTSFYAAKIRHWISEKSVRKLKYVTSLIFVITAIKLLYDEAVLLGWT